MIHAKRAAHAGGSFRFKTWEDEHIALDQSQYRRAALLDGNARANSHDGAEKKRKQFIWI
jgi:hypothetical protein